MKKNQAAKKLGQMGGKVKSVQKLRSSRINGALGGRPKINSVSLADHMRRVLRGGDWKIEFFEFVDDFRKRPDIKFLLPKPNGKNSQLFSLASSMALYLCHECKISPPDWIIKGQWLSKPYFVGDFQGLKATALLESPLEFRKNNIWVLSNFMDRV